LIFGQILARRDEEMADILRNLGEGWLGFLIPIAQYIFPASLGWQIAFLFVIGVCLPVLCAYFCVWFIILSGAAKLKLEI